MRRRLLLATAMVLPAFMAALVLLGLGSAPDTVSAQAPIPPHRFFGTATIDGQPAASGTSITAQIGGKECGTGTVQANGQYLIDVASGAQEQGCGGNNTAISFVSGGRTATQMPLFRSGGFEQLNLTFGPAGPTPRGYRQAALDLNRDVRPCIPEPGQAACDDFRRGLWNGEAGPWATMGVFDGDARFNETVVFRVQAGDPVVISIIAKFLEAPYLKVTRIQFQGGEEFVEVTNLGGGPQDMTGWSLRSPERDARTLFPQNFVMAPDQVCRIYSQTPGAMSCGNATFNRADVWPDDVGRVVLYYDALDLPGDDTRYSSFVNAQPVPPNLHGIGPTE